MPPTSSSASPRRRTTRSRPISQPASSLPCRDLGGRPRGPMHRCAWWQVIWSAISGYLAAANEYGRGDPQASLIGSAATTADVRPWKPYTMTRSTAPSGIQLDRRSGRSPRPLVNRSHAHRRAVAKKIAPRAVPIARPSRKAALLGRCPIGDPGREPEDDSGDDPADRQSDARFRPVRSRPLGGDGRPSGRAHPGIWCGDVRPDCPGPGSPGPGCRWGRGSGGSVRLRSYLTGGAPGSRSATIAADADPTARPRSEDQLAARCGDPRAVPRVLRRARPHGGAEREPRAGRRPDSAVHQQRHGPVQGRPDRRRAARLHPRRRLPAGAARRRASTTTSRRSAARRATTRCSRCSATGASATTSSATRSTGRGIS